MRPSQGVGDWLTLLGLFAIGLPINAMTAVLGLIVLELLGLWPIILDVGARANSHSPRSVRRSPMDRMMAMSVAPVIGRASVELRLSTELQGRLNALAAGRPLIIDYYASCLRGVVVGDIVWFGEPPSEPCYVELEPIGKVPIRRR